MPLQEGDRLTLVSVYLQRNRSVQGEPGGGDDDLEHRGSQQSHFDRRGGAARDGDGRKGREADGSQQRCQRCGKTGESQRNGSSATESQQASTEQQRGNR